jgi:hypothetical protein
MCNGDRLHQIYSHNFITTRILNSHRKRSSLSEIFREQGTFPELFEQLNIRLEQQAQSSRNFKELAI